MYILGARRTLHHMQTLKHQSLGAWINHAVCSTSFWAVVVLMALYLAMLVMAIWL